MIQYDPFLKTPFVGALSLSLCCCLCVQVPVLAITVNPINGSFHSVGGCHIDLVTSLPTPIQIGGFFHDGASVKRINGIRFAHDGSKFIAH